MDYKDNPRVHIDNNGKMFVDGVEVRVKNVVFEDKKGMTAAYRDLKNSFDLGAVGAEEFYAELEILRDFYLQEGSAAWWNYTRKILDYEQSLKEEELKLIDERVDRLGVMYSLGMISAGQYYSSLESVRDRYFESGSKQWNDYTKAIAKFYTDMLSDAEKSAEKLTDRLWGDVLQSVTIKDKDGKVKDRFYRLAPLDKNLINSYFEGYNFLRDNGAPTFMKEQYLSMSADKASELYGLLRQMGDRLPAYFNEMTFERNSVNNMSREVFGADVLADAVTRIIETLKNSGFAEDIDIHQNFYGSTASPADAAIEAVNALRLQGVEI